MPPLKTAEGVSCLENFMKDVGGAPKEWYVGVATDGSAQLEQHGMQGTPSATTIQCKDEKTARAIAERLVQSGVQPANGDAEPGTEVYLFRAAKLTSFREWLKGQEGPEGEERLHEQQRTQWVAATHRLLDRCQAWLAEVDPDGVLDLQRTSQDKAEAGVGRYKVPILVIAQGDVRVYITPVARNTPRTLPLPSGEQAQAVGRVEIVNGLEKHTLYRAEVEGKENWYVLPGQGPLVALNEDVFMAIMEDLFS